MCFFNVCDKFTDTKSNVFVPILVVFSPAILRAGIGKLRIVGEYPAVQTFKLLTPR